MTRRFHHRVALVALGLLLAGCSIDLQHNLSEQDANEIYVLLSKNGISVQKILDASGNEPAYTIKVAKTDAAQGAELMRENSLPRPHFGGFDEFRKNKGMIPTQAEEKAMMLEALGGEVTSALNKVDGVLETRVIPNVPDNNDLTQPDKKIPTTASVFVKYRPNLEGKPPLDEAHIKAWVANALPDTRPDNVSVLLTAAQPVNTESRISLFETILGIQIARSSVATFKTVMGFMGALVILMAGITGFVLLRGSQGGSPSPKVRRRVAEE